MKKTPFTYNFSMLLLPRLIALLHPRPSSAKFISASPLVILYWTCFVFGVNLLSTPMQVSVTTVKNHLHTSAHATCLLYWRQGHPSCHRSLGIYIRNQFFHRLGTFRLLKYLLAAEIYGFKRWFVEKANAAVKADTLLLCTTGPKTRIQYNRRLSPFKLEYTSK